MVSDQKHPIRILHIVGGMNPGGVETWLMHVLRRLDKNQFQFDFLTHTPEACFYDNEIRSHGSRIIPCLNPHRPWQYARNFYRILKECGPYDVVHSHVHHFSGFTLMLARRFGVSMRIAHSHNDTSSKDKRAGLWRKFYLSAMKRLIHRYATKGLACSRLAAGNLFGENWELDPRWKVLYCGIDLEPFKQSFNREKVRRELGISPDAFVLGHVGRFDGQKNHSFLLEIFAEVLRREPNAYLLLVGDGPLRKAIEEKTRRLGLEGKVIFAGMRHDVPRLMLAAMDVFVFPSHHEGLPLALIEAQAAGLPSVITDVISDEVVVSSLVRTLGLYDKVTTWGESVLKGPNIRQRSSSMQQFLDNAKFNIVENIKELSNIYLSGPNL